MEWKTLAANRHLQFVPLAASLLSAVVDAFVAAVAVAASSQSQALRLRLLYRLGANGSGSGAWLQQLGGVGAAVL